MAQVRETAGFLAKPRVELPRLDVAGITVDPRATAAQLAAGADELAGRSGPKWVAPPRIG